jgi:hypothetical protein
MDHRTVWGDLSDSEPTADQHKSEAWSRILTGSPSSWTYTNEDDHWCVWGDPHTPLALRGNSNVDEILHGTPPRSYARICHGSTLAAACEIVQRGFVVGPGTHTVRGVVHSGLWGIQGPEGRGYALERAKLHRNSTDHLADVRQSLQRQSQQPEPEPRIGALTHWITCWSCPVVIEFLIPEPLLFTLHAVGARQVRVRCREAAVDTRLEFPQEHMRVHVPTAVYNRYKEVALAGTLQGLMDRSLLICKARPGRPDDLLDEKRLDAPSCGKIICCPCGGPSSWNLPLNWVKSNTGIIWCLECWRSKRDALPFVETW